MSDFTNPDDLSEYEKGERRRDAETVIGFSVERIRSQYEAAFVRAGLDAYSVTEVGWKALVETKFPLTIDPQADVRNQELEYELHTKIAKQVSRELLADCDFLQEYESVCQDLKIDVDAFSWAYVRSVMVTAV